jgi:hypothetical protein
MERSEKLNYIEAVQCLGKKKAKTPSAVAAGAKTRYDDFVVTHIQLTQVTHGNVRPPAITILHRSLTLLRATFCLGTATICGRTNRHCAMSADIKDISPTTTGHGGHVIPFSHLFSMAARRAFLGMENTYPVAIPPAYPVQNAVSWKSRPHLEAAVSPLAHSKSESNMSLVMAI